MRRIGLISVFFLAIANAPLHADVTPGPLMHRHVLRADPTNKFTYVGPPRTARLGALAQATTATFQVTYVDVPPDAQVAFQRAIDIWATQIVASVPITIQARFTPMDSFSLGWADTTFWAVAPDTSRYYPTPLANQRVGYDLNPGVADIHAEFNSQAAWSFQTGPVANRYDFTSVVLHEIAHGLGFMGSAQRNDAGVGYLYSPPIVYDEFIANASGSPVTSFSSGSTELGFQLVSDRLFWTGLSGTTGNGGTHPKIYAPVFWYVGSSYHHIDEATFPAGDPNSLMTPGFGAAEVILDPGPLTRGVLRDIGWTVAGMGQPALTVSQTFLAFGATTGLGVVTSPQTLTITQSGGTSAIPWTMTTDVDWLRAVSTSTGSGSGSGSGTVEIAVLNSASLPAAGNRIGHVTLSSSAAWNTPVTITVLLSIRSTDYTAPPYGSFDTPINGTSGTTGSTPVTGWALDDIEVTRVRIYRSAVSPEPASALVFIGNAVLVDGARPDVELLSPTVPLRSRAGWGYLMLTNALPGGGNGTYTLHAYADDRDGHTTFLGSRTITCANASATKPFGAIDTPGQGGVASGTAYRNFGWALTPRNKTIPLDGSTINVFVDGVRLGSVNYNDYRPDVAALFPNYANTNGAGGYRDIDMTVLANGVHTIAWGVVDNQGAAEGIGSRYFTVRNATSSSIANIVSVPPRASLAAFDTAAPVQVLARAGFDSQTPSHILAPAPDGVRRMAIEELGRAELMLASGNARCGASGPLPIGAALDEETGLFTWAPGPGFLGEFALTFSCRQASGRTEPIPVIVSISPRRPRGPRASVPRSFIDIPAWGETIRGSFRVAGWSLDEASVDGPGIATIHVWAYPIVSGKYGEPVFLGVAAQGGQRPDVARAFGSRFERSGYSLSVERLSPGSYDIAVFAFSTLTNTFAPAATVRVSIE